MAKIRNSKQKLDELVLDEDKKFEVPKKIEPPNCVDIEKELIGSILIDNFILNDVIQIVNYKHFFKKAHSEIFSAIVNLNNRGEAIDIHTLIEELKKMGKLEEVGDKEYIAELASYVTTSANYMQHARIILEKYILRGLIYVSGEIIEKAIDPSVNTFNLLNTAEQNLLNISESLSKKKVINVKEEIEPFYEELYKRRKDKNIITGVPTGFTLLDEYTSGFQKSEFIVIAGRPSHGKTAFILNIARHAAVVHNKTVAIFSLEMTYKELMIRLIASEARVDARNLKIGKLTDEEWTRVAKYFPNLRTNILIDDSSEMSVLELRAKARRLKYDYNVDMIMVDYLQLVKGQDNPERRDLEVAYVSRNLKALAKDLDIPVVACAQLNRGVETRGSKDKGPQLADLRESGAIEQDADVVLFVHRPALLKKLDEDDPEVEKEKRKALIIIGKQRNGPTTSFELEYIAEHTCFTNATPQPVVVIPEMQEPGF